jgi:hypothetical protein
MVSCIICGREFESVERDIDPSENQPYGGTTFQSYGHYGSTIFDPMDKSWLEINICDFHLELLAKTDRVLLGNTVVNPNGSRKNVYEHWRG